MTIGGVPDTETARRNGSKGGGDNMVERPCPVCGALTKRLGHHLRSTDHT